LDGEKKKKRKKKAKIFPNLIHSLEEINSPQEILNEDSSIDTKKSKGIIGLPSLFLLLFVVVLFFMYLPKKKKIIRQLKEVIREVNANLRQGINDR
jgi:hypothetical protein